MKPILISLLTTVCMLFSGLHTEVAAQQGDSSGCYQYTVKFVCGKGDGKILALGYYYTAINILNANKEAATFTKQFVIAPPDRPGSCSNPKSFTLKDCQAIEIDCPEIMESAVFPQGYRSTLYKGFVIIESNQPLDIVAVYTASNLRRQVESIHTERVPANTDAGCSDLIVSRIDRPEYDPVKRASVIEVSFKNVGCAKSEACYGRLIDPSTLQPTGAPFNDVARVPALQPGETVTVTFTLPYWVFNPDAELETEVDYKKMVSECNENNNTKKYFEKG